MQTTRETPVAMVRVMTACAFIVLAGGAVSLLGHFTGIETLRRLGIGATAMRANAALALVLLGAAGIAARRSWWAASVLGLLAATIGGATLFQYVTGVELGIDRLIPGRTPPADARMSLRAAAALLLAGSAEAAYGAGIRGFFVRLAAGAAGFIAFVSLAAWAFGAQFLPSFVPTQIAAATAVLMLIWSAGFLLRAGNGLAGLLSAGDGWGRAARTMTLLALTVPIALGEIVLYGATRGWYDLPFAVALLVATSGTALLLMSSRYAIRLRQQELDRQTVDAERQASDARFRSLYEGNIIGIEFWEFDGRIVEANDALLEIFGVQRVDLPSLRWDSYIAPESEETVRTAVGEIQATGKAAPFEVECIRPDGSAFSILVQAATVPGTTVNIALVLDITERARTRRALEETVSILQHRVAHLEGVDEQAQLSTGDIDLLRQEVESLAGRLGDATEELETFSYSVSHDLRAPLRAIDGFSRELQTEWAERLDDRAKHYLNRIRTATQRMSALIDDLLELSRLSRKPMKRVTVDLTALASEVAVEARERAGREIRFEIEPALKVEADPNLLRIVLDNLIGNAVKFSGRVEHPHVEVFEAGPRCFAVRDNGAGFDPQYASKMFAPFQRFHSTAFEGTGIGLAIVQRIIRRHGGSVRAESRPGEGATFFFTLSPHTGDQEVRR